MKRILPDVAAAVLLVLLVLFHHGPELLGAGVTAFVDSSRFFFPVWKWAQVVWQDGLIPLWNPLFGTGQPFLADPQTTSAYPPVPLLYLILPPMRAFAWLLASHHAWTLLGFYAFARGRRFEVLPSFFGAVAFGMSLHVACMSWTPVALFAVSWIPWAFAVSGLLWQGRRGSVLLLSVVLALQLAAGYPVYSYLTMLALAAEALFRLGDRALFVSWGKGFAAAVLLSVGLNLVWALPFLEFYLGTDLRAGKYYQPLGLWDLATALSPFVNGHPLEKGYSGPHYWVATFYAGLPTLFVAAWGIATGRVRKSTAWLFLLFVVLSLGETALLGGLLKRVLPGYALVIRSGFLISLVLFFGCLSAVEALQEAGRMKRPHAHDTWIACAAFVLIYGAALILGVASESGDPWRIALETALLGVAVAAFWTSRGPGTRRLGMGAAILALLLSLMPGVLSLRFLLAPSYYESLPEILPRLTRAGRLLHSPVLMKNARVLSGETAEEAYYLAKQWMYPNWPMTFDRGMAVGYNTLQWGPSRNWVDAAFRISPSFSKKAADYLGVRYFFGKTTLPGLIPVPSGGPDVEVAENPGAMPRWFPVPRAYRAGEPLEDMQRNADSQFDFSKGCFIRDPRWVGTYVDCRVKELKRTPNRVELLAEGAPSASGPVPGRILLVSSETAYPGWIFENDWGRRRSLEVVNHAFRGVVLEPGEMHATLTFEPVSFRLGLFLSLAFLGFLGVLFLVLGRGSL